MLFTEGTGMLLSLTMPDPQVSSPLGGRGVAAGLVSNIFSEALNIKICYGMLNLQSLLIKSKKGNARRFLLLYCLVVELKPEVMPAGQAAEPQPRCRQETEDSRTLLKFPPAVA